MCRYTSGAAAGLAYLHRHGIVHDNLRPSNLLVRGSSMPCVGILSIGTAQKK